jgi:hypothetical protein
MESTALQWVHITHRGDNRVAAQSKINSHIAYSMSFLLSFKESIAQASNKVAKFWPVAVLLATRSYYE